MCFQIELSRLAIDGLVVASQQGPGVADVEALSSSGSGFNPLVLGTLINGFQPAGMFRNLTIYDRALTSAELAGIAAPSTLQDFTSAPTAWTNVSGTWTWDGATWTEHHSVPAVVSAFGVAEPVIAAERPLVLLGGSQDAGAYRDAWTWDGVTWRRR